MSNRKMSIGVKNAVVKQPVRLLLLQVLSSYPEDDDGRARPRFLPLIAVDLPVIM
jgi:hypothetical protein